jgi:hypothetical protein
VSVRPFDCGAQFCDWCLSNCNSCTLYDYDNPKCEIDRAIGIAFIVSGEVSDEIARRMGINPDSEEVGPYIWRCPERVPR